MNNKPEVENSPIVSMEENVQELTSMPASTEQNETVEKVTPQQRPPPPAVTNRPPPPSTPPPPVQPAPPPPQKPEAEAPKKPVAVKQEKSGLFAHSADLASSNISVHSKEEPIRNQTLRPRGTTTQPKPPPKKKKGFTLGETPQRERNLRNTSLSTNHHDFSDKQGSSKNLEYSVYYSNKSPQNHHNRSRSLETPVQGNKYLGKSSSKNSLSESHELVKKVKLTKLLEDHENFGKDLLSIRTALGKIAKAQKKYSEKITHIISTHASNLHLGKNDRLLGTFSVLFRLMEMCANKHNEVGKYLTNVVEPELQRLQAGDKHHLQTARTKYKNSLRKVELAKNHSVQCRKQYFEDLKLCQLMSDPDWKPAENKSFFGFGKQQEKVLPQELVGRQYEQLCKSEENYEEAVINANSSQKEHLESSELLKIECQHNQLHRYTKCIRHLEKIRVLCEDVTNGSECKNSQNLYNAHFESLDQDDLLTKQYERLKNRFGEDLPPPDFKLETTGWKNIFVSVEAAMIPEKNSNIPYVMDILCTKIKQKNGFQTEGIFRKAADQHQKNNIRRLLIDGKYEFDVDSPHIPACVLKDWLRNLKEPLIPNIHYDICIDMAKAGRLSHESLQVFLSQIPEYRRNTIKYLVKFLRELCTEENKHITKMDVKNVAIVFGPNLLRCNHSDPQVMLANSGFEREFCQKLIENLDLSRDPWLEEQSNMMGEN